MARDGCAVTVRYSRVGSDGQANTKELASEELTECHADGLIYCRIYRKVRPRLPRLSPFQRLGDCGILERVIVRRTGFGEGRHRVASRSCKARSIPPMKVVDLNEAKANLEGYAEACQQSPVFVTIGGIRKCELVPIHTDDPDFIDRLLEENESFRRLAEESRREADEGRVSTLADVRKRLEASS